jgi:hypothetical protein
MYIKKVVIEENEWISISPLLGEFVEIVYRLVPG